MGCGQSSIDSTEGGHGELKDVHSSSEPDNGSGRRNQTMTVVTDEVIPFESKFTELNAAEKKETLKDDGASTQSDSPVSVPTVEDWLKKRSKEGLVSAPSSPVRNKTIYQQPQSPQSPGLMMVDF